MHKRGQAETWQLSALFELLIGIAVASFLIIAATSWYSISNFSKDYVEEDIKLVSNAVLSSPGEIRLAYRLSRDFKVEIMENVKVMHEQSLGGMIDKSVLIFESGPKKGLTIRRADA